jgi:hypothetical protein
MLPKLTALLWLAAGGIGLSAQEPSPQPSQPFFVRDIRQRLDRPEALRIVLPPESPTPRKLGALNLAAPDFQRGEVIKISLPVGDLAMQLSRKIAAAQRERADRKAAERVQRDLDRFLASQPK